MTSISPRRRTALSGVGTGQRSEFWMLNQLPVGMLDSPFFVRFVSLSQELADTLLEDADNIDNLIDVTVGPDAMVRYLGAWIGFDSIDPALPHDLQRRIVTSSAQTLAWRGTKRGLLHFLELASGGAAEVEDGGGVWRDGEAPTDTAWVRMRVETTGWMPESDFVTLIRDEVPAHVRAELFVGERCVWRSTEETP